MKLEWTVDWLHKSSARLKELLPTPRDPEFWLFMWRESTLHVRRSLELMWIVWRKHDD